MSSSSSSSDSSSSSSSSDSSSNPKILVQPESKLKFGEVSQMPGARAPNKHDTESGMSSIDSKPSIKQPPKHSDLRFNPQVMKKPTANQGPVQRLKSFKYEKKIESLSSSGELSSDSGKSSMINLSDKKLIPVKSVDPAAKVLNPVDIPLNVKQQEKSYEQVLNYISLNDKPLPIVKPEVQPNRPSVPKLHLEKINPSIKPPQNNLPNLKVSNLKEDKVQAVLKVPVALATGLEGNEESVKKPELRSAKYVRKDKESSKSKSSSSSESSKLSKESPISSIIDDSEINIVVDKHHTKELIIQ